MKAIFAPGRHLPSHGGHLPDGKKSIRRELSALFSLYFRGFCPLETAISDEEPTVYLPSSTEEVHSQIFMVGQPKKNHTRNCNSENSPRLHPFSVGRRVSKQKCVQILLFGTNPLDCSSRDGYFCGRTSDVAVDLRNSNTSSRLMRRSLPP